MAIITGKQVELEQRLARILSSEASPSATELSEVLSTLVDQVIEHKRLPDDAKRGVLANFIEYAELSLRQLEPRRK